MTPLQNMNFAQAIAMNDSVLSVNIYDKKTGLHLPLETYIKQYARSIVEQSVPKRMRVEDCSCHLTPPCRSCQDQSEADVAYIDSHNTCRAQTLSNANNLLK